MSDELVGLLGLSDVGEAPEVVVDGSGDPPVGGVDVVSGDPPVGGVDIVVESGVDVSEVGGVTTLMLVY